MTLLFKDIFESPLKVVLHNFLTKCCNFREGLLMINVNMKYDFVLLGICIMESFS